MNNSKIAFSNLEFHSCSFDVKKSRDNSKAIQYITIFYIYNAL